MRTVSGSQATSPTLVFEPRPVASTPLKDCTNYELLKHLEGQGWEWQHWVPPGSRSQKLKDAFQPYRAGGEKIWFTSKSINRYYVQVLLESTSLFERGLVEVPHGRPEADYKRFLSGDVSLCVSPIRDAPRDIECDGIVSSRKTVPRYKTTKAAAAAAAAGADDVDDAACIEDAIIGGASADGPFDDAGRLALDILRQLVQTS